MRISEGWRISLRNEFSALRPGCTHYSPEHSIFSTNNGALQSSSPLPSSTSRRSPSHLKLGSPCVHVTLLVQLPPSGQCPLPLPHRQASRHPRLPDYPHASRRHGLQSTQCVSWHRLQQCRSRARPLRRQYRGWLSGIRSHSWELHKAFDWSTGWRCTEREKTGQWCGE